METKPRPFYTVFAALHEDLILSGVEHKVHATTITDNGTVLPVHLVTTRGFYNQKEYRVQRLVPVLSDAYATRRRIGTAKQENVKELSAFVKGISR